MSKSLGTLTLDLVANTAGFVQGMDKSERQTKAWTKQVSKDLDAIKNAAGIASAALSAATVALVATSVKSAAEIGKLSQIANTSFEEFQRMAAGAQLVGVEQTKLGDILKDVNDKVGDYLQTGGGAMADFFDKIAPKVGVTADQFRDLAGPDALQLYVSSLEKAGVSQSEMTFYMEAIASDATALLPLLRDNGAGFKMLGDEAARAGAFMSEKTLAAADRLQATLFVAKQAGEGFKNQIAESLLPTLGGLTAAFADVSTDGSMASNVGDILSGSIKTLTATAIGAYAAIDNFGNAIGGLLAAASFVVQGEFTKAGDVMRELGSDLEAEVDRYGALLARVWDAGKDSGDSPTEDRIKKIADLLKKAREEAAAASNAVSGSFGASPAASPLSGVGLEMDFDRELEDLRAFREQKLEMYKGYDELELESKREQQAKLQALEEKSHEIVVGNAESISSDLGGIARTMLGEQSSAYKALFAVEKSFAIASSIMSVKSAIANASGSAPFPANLGAMATVAAATAGLVSSIMAVGMAHDGIDSIPKTGTWLLEKGERVVTADTSARLDGVLSDISSKMSDSRGGVGGIRIVNAVDESLVSDFMSSAAGERVILNTISRNGRAIQRLIA